MRIAICPGSFDPVTVGHIDIIRRAASLFDRVIVAVLVNDAKQPLFTLEERMDMLCQSICDIPGVEVDHFGGLLMDYAQAKGACAVIRGLRAVSDFEYEFQMASMNRRLNPEVETVFIMTDTRYSYLSSSMIRTVGSMKGEIAGLVPDQVLDFVKHRLNGRA